MVFYYLRRFVAIALGLCLTAYSAWASWSHQGDLIGPLAAVSAAVLLALSEHAWRDRNRILAMLLGVVGIAAAVISGMIVLERVSHAQEARDHRGRSANLPRIEARRALAEAQQDLAAAQAEARDACRSGRGPRCRATEQREDAARQRVAKARAELVGLGAETAVDPTAGILGDHAATLRLVALLGLPLWLEIAAPIVLAYGFAPAPCRKAERKAEPKRGRRKVKRAPRKPAPPASEPSKHRSAPRLVVIGGKPRTVH